MMRIRTHWLAGRPVEGSVIGTAAQWHGGNLGLAKSSLSSSLSLSSFKFRTINFMINALPTHHRHCSHYFIAIMAMTKSSSINQPHHNCHRCHQYISPSPWANSPLINHPWRYCCLIIIFAKVNFTNQFYNNAWTLNIEHWPITYWQSTAQPVFSKSEQKSPNC